MSAYTCVASIVKTKNLGGSVIAQSADGLPFLLRPGIAVHFVPPRLHGPRKARVRHVRRVSPDAYEVSFEGVSDIDAAEALVGCRCLAATEDIVDMADVGRPETLVGFSVRDDRWGDLGEVTEVLASSAQAALVVDGPHGQVMIPAVDEFVTGLDEVNRLVCVQVPQSLLSLNE